MSDKKTLIVVGAGASKEAGLPTGEELTKQIASSFSVATKDIHHLSDDAVINDAIINAAQKNRTTDGNIGLYKDATLAIHAGMPQSISIDNFIDAHQGDREIEICGKISIARSILIAEQNSLLRKGWATSGLNFQAFEDTWFNIFWKLLTENCRIGRLRNRLSSIGFIVFNYDRCIEHFLYHSIQNYYRVRPEDAANLVLGIEIYHPYGTVGALPWYKSNKPTIEFGAQPSSELLLDLSGQIRTFTEGTDSESSDIEEIHDLVKQSKRVLFLGFAYHDQNLGLFLPAGLETCPCFGTAYRESDSNRQSIVDTLNNLGFRSPYITIQNLECSKFLRDYWRNLSFS
jgi:hypothetical protein